MKNGYVKSSPHFFKLISRSMYALITVLLLLAALIPASLQEQANPARGADPGIIEKPGELVCLSLQLGIAHAFGLAFQGDVFGAMQGATLKQPMQQALGVDRRIRVFQEG